MPSTRFYPKLNRLITVPDLPEFFSFIEQNINDILENLRYNNLSVYREDSGALVQYNVSIIIGEKLDITIPFDQIFGENSIQATACQCFKH